MAAKFRMGFCEVCPHCRKLRRWLDAKDLRRALIARCRDEATLEHVGRVTRGWETLRGRGGRRRELRNVVKITRPPGRPRTAVVTDFDFLFVLAWLDAHRRLPLPRPCMRAFRGMLRDRRIRTAANVLRDVPQTTAYWRRRDMLARRLIGAWLDCTQSGIYAALRRWRTELSEPDPSMEEWLEHGRPPPRAGYPVVEDRRLARRRRLDPGLLPLRKRP
jgi:hypothetical protein